MSLSATLQECCRQAQRFNSDVGEMRFITLLVKQWLAMAARFHPDLLPVYVTWGCSTAHTVRLNHMRRRLVLSRPLLLAREQGRFTWCSRALYHSVMHHAAHLIAPVAHYRVHSAFWRLVARQLGVRDLAPCGAVSRY